MRQARCRPARRATAAARNRVPRGGACREEIAVTPPEARFALNHFIAPRLGLADSFALAKGLGIDAVEIRNDIPGNAILDGTPPGEVRRLAAAAGVAILSINALQRFDDWRGRRPVEALVLADYAQA